MAIQLRFLDAAKDGESAVHLHSEGVWFGEILNRTGTNFEISLFPGSSVTFPVGELWQAVEQSVLELGGNPGRLRDSISLRFAAEIKWLKRPPTTLPWRTKARFRQEDSSAPTLEPWTIVIMPFSKVYEDANETIGFVFYRVAEAGTHFIEPGTAFEILDGNSVVVGQGEKR